MISPSRKGKAGTMRIVMVTQSFPPSVSGASIVAYRLGLLLARRGHEVYSIVASDTGQPYRRTENGVTCLRLKSRPNRLRVDQRYVPWSRLRVRRLLAEIKPDVVHLHDTLSLGLSALLAAKSLRIARVVTIHQLPWFICKTLPKLRPFAPIIEPAAWAYGVWLGYQCQEVVLPSQTIADLVQRRGYGGPAHVISNGIDLDRFTPCSCMTGERRATRELYGIGKSDKVILTVGRIDRDKSVDVVIRAAARAMRNVSAKLVVAGDGVVRLEMEALARRLGIEQDCRFPGFVRSDAGLPELYRAADVFALASTVEIQSSVVLEALASGLPIVAVRASSVPEQVLDGENGYLVSPEDVETMAERLVQVLTDSHLARRMSLRSRAIAELHTPERTVTAHEAVYASAVQAMAQTTRTRLASCRPG